MTSDEKSAAVRMSTNKEQVVFRFRLQVFWGLLPSVIYILVGYLAICFVICLNQKYIINRIIITARSAKGLTEKEVAQELKIDESLYKEIELGISPTTSEMAETLENLYHVPLPGRVSIRGLCAAAGHGRHVINTHSDIRLLLWQYTVLPNHAYNLWDFQPISIRHCTDCYEYNSISQWRNVVLLLTCNQMIFQTPSVSFPCLYLNSLHFPVVYWGGYSLSVPVICLPSHTPWTSCHYSLWCWCFLKRQKNQLAHANDWA